MKKVKKLALTVAAGIMAFSMTGCGSGSGTVSYLHSLVLQCAGCVLLYGLCG